MENNNNNSCLKSSLLKECDIPHILADYIEIERCSKISRPEITSLIWKQLQKRNLVYKLDKRVFRVDEETSKIFGVDASVNNSVLHTDHLSGFNFANLQFYISNALIHAEAKRPMSENYNDNPIKKSMFYSDDDNYLDCE